ncbi:MAG: DUF5596 domain-containing protein [Clostridia bacterium]|nr:DUF5596 domain-containing protein [Clostridia bacterium]
MQNFFDYFEITYSPRLDVHYNSAVENLQSKGNEILDFEKLNIYTYMKDDLAKIRDEIAQDERNLLYCYFLNSVLKTDDMKLIEAAGSPKASAKSEIFDCLPLFSLLYEIPSMRRGLEEKGIPKDIIDATCNMFENQVQDHINLYGRYGVSTYVLWLWLFTRNRIIRVGRFNIEITTFKENCAYLESNKLSVISAGTDAQPPLGSEIIAKEGDRIISVHIPAGGSLDFDMNTADLKRAAEVVTKHFGEFKLFYCSSWLLEPNIEKIMGKETNLTRFANRFTRYYTSDNSKDVFHYLYLTPDTENIAILPEDTSMRRLIKNHLLSGGKILSHKGIFLKTDLH